MESSPSSRWRVTTTVGDDVQISQSPVRTGALTIISVDGDLVHLQTEHGDQVTFDLTSRAFR